MARASDKPVSIEDAVVEAKRGGRAGRPPQAPILLTRGSAGTLGLDDLAALAKGRSPGRGQVLLRLQPTPEDIATCPIGLSAFVEFPRSTSSTCCAPACAYERPGQTSIDAIENWGLKAHAPLDGTSLRTDIAQSPSVQRSCGP